MSIKRTVINADEELVIKGKLTIEGNVTQIETTQQVTNLEGNVFTINSDGSNTSAILALNSNGTTATMTFDDANGNIVLNKPIDLGSQRISTTGNISASNFLGNLTGNVTGFVSSISNFTTTDLREGANLYYTVTRANAAIDARLPNTDALTEGSTNLYYTVARANSAIETYLVGGDGINYASGTIDVDSTVVRTSGTQTIGGNKTFTGTTTVSADVVPSSANTINLGSWANHFGYVFANVLHAEYLDLGDANIADIHNRFVAGSVSAPLLTTNTAGGLTYTHNATLAGYSVSTGDGLQISGTDVAVDNTVIRTTGGQTINGNLTLTGNLVVVNIDSQTQTDSVVSDKVLYLNVGGGTSPNNSKISVEKTAANVYLEYDSRWKFTNDGSTVNNMLLLTDFSAGNGLSYNNAGEYSVVAGDGITAGVNVSVDATVVRTTGDQSIAGIKNFTGELVIPSGLPTSNNTIYVNAGNTAVYAYVNGVHVQLTADSDVGQVEDVGATGIDIYAGANAVLLGNNTIYYHGIKSIDGGTYTSLSDASNVITVDANITAIRGAFSTANIAGYGGIGYDSANGVFNYSGVTDSQIRGLFSGSGLISYNSGTGAITTTADNYGGWTVQTDSGVGAAESITSAEKLTIQGGTNITVTNTGNVITITNDNTADITSVSAGNGLTGGGNNGDVTLNIGAGAGITVNADNVALTSGVVTAAAQSGGISAITVDTYGRVTGVTANAGYTTNTGTVTSVSGGNGLTGTVTTTGSLNVGAGAGITVNADDVAVNVAYVRSQFSATGDLSYNASTGVFSFTNDAGDIESVGAGAGLTGGGTSGAVTLNIGAGTGITVNADSIQTNDSQIVHDNLSGFVSNEHIDHSTVSITAGSGLTGGGTIASTRTINVGAGSYIIVNADDVAVDATTAATASKVVARDGAGNVYANYFVGTATAAQYADLAENYQADAEYVPGTVLVFGGSAEVTACFNFESTKVAGVVTTQPAHVMNSGLTGPNVACIALRGRVPVLVKGVARKGDVLVTAGEGKVGYAVASGNPREVPAAAIVGKAISDKTDPGLGVVEALI